MFFSWDVFVSNLDKINEAAWDIMFTIGEKGRDRAKTNHGLCLIIDKLFALRGVTIVNPMPILICPAI